MVKVGRIYRKGGSVCVVVMLAHKGNYISRDAWGGGKQALYHNPSPSSEHACLTNVTPSLR